MSGACRESHQLERVYDRLHHAIRNGDKMLWHYCGKGDVTRSQFPLSDFNTVQELFDEIWTEMWNFKAEVEKESKRAIDANNIKFPPKPSGTESLLKSPYPEPMIKDAKLLGRYG